MRKPILLLSLLLALPAAAARSAWLTVGDAAYQHVRAVPGTRMHAARQADPAFGAGSERVYLLEVPSTSVPRLSRLLHAKLKHCGGFMRHPDEATARAALVQAPQVMAAGARPSYAISSQAIVTPALAAMDEARIARHIQDLSAFPSRLYSSTHGANASHWLRDAWAALALRHVGASVEQVRHAGYQQASVIATIAGSDLAAEVIVLGAHLDSINGALPATKALPLARTMTRPAWLA